MKHERHASQGPSELSLDALWQRQQEAFSEWERTAEAVPLLEAWIDIHAAVTRTRAPERFLGVAAVLWQELNAQWEARDLPRDLSKLLNQFIAVSFPGINPWLGSAFSPVVALDAESWHPALCGAVRAMNELDATASAVAIAERRLDALSIQYRTVFELPVVRRTRAFLAAQTAELPRAAACRVSSLVAIDRIEWQAHVAEAQAVLELLAGVASRPLAARDLRWWPDGDAVEATRQLLGYWVSHAPWFERFIRRHTGSLLLAPRVELRLPAPDSLNPGTGCDAHVLLVTPGASARRWLLAAEACPATGLELASIGSLDVGEVRKAWQAGLPLAEAEAEVVPELVSQRRPGSLCRLLSGETPRRFIDRAARARQGTKDDPRVLLHRDHLGIETPSAAVALFDLSTLPAAQLRIHQRAVADVADVLNQSRSRRDGFTWCVVFDGASRLLELDDAEIDPRSRAEFAAALRGITFDSGVIDLVAVTGDSPDALIRAVLLDPRSRQSPAFAKRIQSDLGEIRAFLQTLLEHGFDTLGVAYTDSAASEANRWPFFAHLWAYLERRIVAATLRHRTEYLRQRFVALLERYVLSQKGAADVAGSAAALLDQVTEVSEPTRERAATRFSSLWEELERQLRTVPLTPASFTRLWEEGEKYRHQWRAAARARQECLSSLLDCLLLELGIPTLELGELHRLSTAEPKVASLQASHWEMLSKLMCKPQPVSGTDPDLAAFPALLGTDPSSGAVGDHSVLSQHELDDGLRALIHEKPDATVSDVLRDPSVCMDEKRRLLLSLRGHDVREWRTTITLRRGERDATKWAVVVELRQHVLRADLILLHLIHLTVETYFALAVEPDPAGMMRDHRRSQLVRLLDAAGWAPSLSADVSAAEAGLRRLIVRWKDFYRARRWALSFLGNKRVQQSTAALQEEYRTLRKPTTQPVLTDDMPLERAEELERGAYLAACLLELIARLDPRSDSVTIAQAEPQVADVRDYCRKARSLLEHYTLAKSRYLVREAALHLDRSQWLAGCDAQLARIGQEVLSQIHLDPARLAAALSAAIERAVEAHEEQLTQGATASTTAPLMVRTEQDTG